MSAFRKISIDEVDWFSISSMDSPIALALVQKYSSYVKKQTDLDGLLQNPNPDAFALYIQLCSPDEWKWQLFSNSSAPHAMDLLRTRPEYINWALLSHNPAPCAIQLLQEHPELIDWSRLSENPNPEAIVLLLKNPDKINWYSLSLNTSPKAIELLRLNPEKICWSYLSKNASAIDILKANPTRINLHMLSSNPGASLLFDEFADLMLTEQKYEVDWNGVFQNPSAMGLIRRILQHPHSFPIRHVSETAHGHGHWYQLSQNPAAIKLCLENPAYIDWWGLSQNSAEEAIELIRDALRE